MLRGAGQVHVGGSGGQHERTFPMLPPSTSPVSDRLRELDERFVAQVAEVTRSELADHQRQLEEISPETGALVDALAGYLEGGKLLRSGSHSSGPERSSTTVVR